MMSISTVTSFSSFQEDAWGNFQCLPREIIREIFRYVIGGKEGPLHFARLARTCQKFYALLPMDDGSDSLDGDFLDRRHAIGSRPSQ